MMELTIGQTVRVLPYGFEYGLAKRTRRGLPVLVHSGEVVKIGRTRVTVDVGLGYPNHVQFSMETGQECVKDFGRRIETDQIWAERELRSDLLEQLMKHGLSFNSTGREQLVETDKLKDILAILEGTCPVCGREGGEVVCWRCT